MYLDQSFLPLTNLNENQGLLEISLKIKLKSIFIITKIFSTGRNLRNNFCLASSFNGRNTGQVAGVDLLLEAEPSVGPRSPGSSLLISAI